MEQAGTYDEAVEAKRYRAKRLGLLSLSAICAVLAIFLITLKRRNAERDRLQKNLEAALETARHASQAKSQFLASVSHDICKP